MAFIGPSTSPSCPTRARSIDFDAERDEYEGWERFNRHYWRRDFEGFCEWFFGMMFPEPHSTRQIETGVEWASGTTAELLIKTVGAPS